MPEAFKFLNLNTLYHHNSMMAFLRACSEGDLAEMRRIGPSLDLLYANNDHGETAMWLACANGHLDAAKLLVELYPDEIRYVCMRSRNNNHESPLWIACANGHLKVAQWLYENGEDVNFLNTKLESPLWAACSNGHLEVVQWLFSLPTLQLVDLCVCAAARHLEVVKWLVGEKMPIAGGDWSAMVSACVGGNLDVVKWLYLNGASLTAANADFETPMWGACANGHLEIAKWIYSVEMVDLAVTTVDGLTYMMAACSSGHLETAKWLYSVGASVHPINTFEENAMTMACEYGDLSVVEWLYQMGMGVRATNAIGQTCLMLACSNGRLEVARWLFHHGADPDIHISDVRGMTALGRACVAGALDVAQWLYSQGARLSNDSSTPWSDLRLDEVAYYTVVSKHWEVVFWLHEKGARLIPNLLAHVDSGLACRMILQGIANTDEHVDQMKLHYLRDPHEVRGRLSRQLRDTSEFYRLMNEVRLPDLWCLVAEFAGVVRGRPLRNVREALALLDCGRTQ